MSINVFKFKQSNMHSPTSPKQKGILLKFHELLHMKSRAWPTTSDYYMLAVISLLFQLSKLKASFIITCLLMQTAYS